MGTHVVLWFFYNCKEVFVDLSITIKKESVIINGDDNQYRLFSIQWFNYTFSEIEGLFKRYFPCKFREWYQGKYLSLKSINGLILIQILNKLIKINEK